MTPKDETVTQHLGGSTSDKDKPCAPARDKSHKASDLIIRYFEVVDGREQEVYPCRCGETHRGDYAAYDFAHHNCFHDESLLWIEKYECAICGGCGKTFHFETCTSRPDVEPPDFAGANK